MTSQRAVVRAMWTTQEASRLEQKKFLSTSLCSMAPSTALGDIHGLVDYEQTVCLRSNSNFGLISKFKVNEGAFAQDVFCERTWLAPT